MAHFLTDKPTTRFERVSPDSTRPPAKPGAAPSDTWIDGQLEREGPIADLARRAQRRVGQVIADRYKLRRLLGVGASGAVFRALDLSGENPDHPAVALKVLHDVFERSEEHVGRFSREAKAASTIGHGGVVKVVDAGSDGRGVLYIAMELLSGESLFYAVNEKTLGDDDILQVGQELIEALEATHAEGIVHRDVKPENIFLADEGDGRRVKLFDFGIAKCQSLETSGAYSTVDGLLVGTPHYMSPEMCRGEAVTEAADLWAAAAVLFHAFAGRPPFDEDHVGQLLMRISSQRAPSLSRFRPDLPPEIRFAIDKGLDRDPSKRFASARAFREALGPGVSPLCELSWDELETATG